ncbi:MAG: alkaline phosphatase D family protein [Planctomycetes bacterium]|nr:alkaline phosphatase D family protein [Planctomycetota bacterium]
MTLRLAACGAAIALFCAAAQAQNGFSLGVASGDMTPTTAVLWARADQPGVLRLELARTSAFESIDRSIEVESLAYADLSAKVLVDGLAPATLYYYRFVRIDDATAVSPTGRFQTPPPDDQPAAFRFAFSGDTNFAYAPFDVAAALAAENADLFIWFGDTIYADASSGGLGAATTLEEYRAKYRQIRSDAGIRDTLAAMPIWVGGDDHEVRNDYAGASDAVSAQQKRDAYQAFFEYMPLPRQSESEPARLYRKLRFGANAEFFFLDERQYRDASAKVACASNPDPYGVMLGPLTRDEACLRELSAERTMLGAEQLQWLLDGLRSSNARLKFVVNNVPLTFLGVYPYDRWDGYDAERRTILEYIDANAIDGVVFLTTDIHANALNPDLESDFRGSRFDYAFEGNVRIPEVIVGPLGNQTMYGTITEVGGGGLQAPLTLALRTLSSKVTRIDGLNMIQTDRVSYCVIEVTADGTWSVRYSGEPGATASDGAADGSVFYNSAVAAPSTTAFAFPCALPVIAGGLVGMLFLRHRRGVQTSR